MGNSANVLYIHNKSTETNKSLNAKKRNKRSNKEAKCNMKMINTNTFRFT